MVKLFSPYEGSRALTLTNKYGKSAFLKIIGFFLERNHYWLKTTLSFIIPKIRISIPFLEKNVMKKETAKERTWKQQLLLKQA